MGLVGEISGPLPADPLGQDGDFEVIRRGVGFLKQKLTVAIVGLLCLNLIAPVAASADTMDELNRKENAVLKQSNQISGEVQTALTAANDTYAKVTAARKAVAENQQAIEKAQKEIVITQKTIEKRKTAVGQRLKSIQVNGGMEYSWTALLDAESITDFVNRAVAINQLQSSEKEKIDSLHAEKEKLVALQNEVEEKQAALKENEAALEDEAAELEDRIADLQQQLAKNQDTLTSIAASKEVEQARITAEKEAAAKKAAAEKKAAQQAAAEKAAAKQAAEEAAKESQATTEKPADDTGASSTGDSSASSSESQTPESTEEPPAEKPETGNSGSESGSTGNNESGAESGGNYTVMTFETTAYSWKEAGASPYTASGTDLRTNPQAVAVDPSVIPLGTVVEVEGYGIAVALDTGGAIKGHIMDVHITDLDAMHAWGRRSAQVKVFK